jgi:NAD-dependent deacetylase
MRWIQSFPKRNPRILNAVLLASPQLQSLTRRQNRNMSSISSESKQLTEFLRRSTKLLVFTGAGISTGSGIPDFRGPNGVWQRRQPVYYQDFMASEAARIEHWDYKLEGWPAFRAAKPNATHEALVRLESAGKLLLIVTQNIDGLHSKAGTSVKRLVELHGTNRLVECQTCHQLSDPEPHFESFRKTRRPPLCACGGFLKPATISFGQSLRDETLARAEEAARQADSVVALGSTLSVYPAAEIPLRAAGQGAPYAIINRGPTEHDGLPQVTLRMEGDVAEIFPPAVTAAMAGCGGVSV